MNTPLHATNEPRFRWLLLIGVVFLAGLLLVGGHWFREHYSLVDAQGTTASEGLVPKLTIMVDSYSPEFDDQKRLIRVIHGTTPENRSVLDQVWQHCIRRYAEDSHLPRLWDIPDYPMVSIRYQAGNVDVELTSVHPLFMMRDNGPVISSGPIAVTSESKDGGKGTIDRDQRQHPEYYVFRDEFDEILAMAGVTLQTFRDAYGLGPMPAKAEGKK
ncbi:MAG: hypothetical protein KDK97_02795 [Verrucomicrobiales bacterium]|nr:hypothetical protein [Verrucomicrobiales bacterium]MCP5560416.1 hypothetical protein [Verrucomicrobiaceae bacterium]